MFLRSKIQEMILRRRSRPMNSGAGAQRGYVPDQVANSSTVPCDGDSDGADAGGGSGRGKSATAGALFASPRLSHSSSLPAGTVFARGAVPDAESETAAFSMSPTSVLDAAASFRSGSDAVGNSRRRPGLADALDCSDQQQERVVLAATSPWSGRAPWTAASSSASRTRARGCPSAPAAAARQRRRRRPIHGRWSRRRRTTPASSPAGRTPGRCTSSATASSWPTPTPRTRAARRPRRGRSISRRAATGAS